jgi:hypothetical protein
MKETRIQAVIALPLLLLLAVVAYQCLKSWRRDRWAQEGQAAVEKYLRESTDPRVTDLGSLQSITGDGWVLP